MDDMDDIFYETLYDASGNEVKRLKEQSPITHTTSNFTTYDDSHGHCALCGSIRCNGSCFK